LKRKLPHCDSNALPIMKYRYITKKKNR